MEFDKVKSVTRMILKPEPNKPFYVEFQGAVTVGEKIKDDGKEPPHLANVLNLETGEESVIILGAVFLSELTKAYPDDAYVGKQFMVVKQAPEGVRKYSLWQITEIKVKAAKAEKGTK